MVNRFISNKYTYIYIYLYALKNIRSSSEEQNVRLMYYIVYGFIATSREKAEGFVLPYKPISQTKITSIVSHSFFLISEVQLRKLFIVK